MARKWPGIEMVMRIKAPLPGMILSCRGSGDLTRMLSGVGPLPIGRRYSSCGATSHRIENRHGDKVCARRVLGEAKNHRALRYAEPILRRGTRGRGPVYSVLCRKSTLLVCEVKNSVTPTRRNPSAIHVHLGNPLESIPGYQLH